MGEVAYQSIEVHMAVAHIRHDKVAHIRRDPGKAQSIAF